MPVHEPNDQSFTVNRQVLERLDQVLHGQSQLEKAQSNLEVYLEVRITGLQERLTVVEKSVDELTRTLRGFNGTPGLITDVALIKEAVRAKKGNDEAGNEDEGEEDDSGGVTWRWLVEKVGLPVITAFVLWFLLTILPDLLQHLGGG